MAAVPGHLHVHAYDYTHTDNEKAGEKKKQRKQVKNRKGNINLRKCFEFRFHS